MFSNICNLDIAQELVTKISWSYLEYLRMCLHIEHTISMIIIIVFLCTLC